MFRIAKISSVNCEYLSAKFVFFCKFSCVLMPLSSSLKNSHSPKQKNVLLTGSVWLETTQLATLSEIEIISSRVHTPSGPIGSERERRGNGMKGREKDRRTRVKTLAAPYRLISPLKNNSFWEDLSFTRDVFSTQGLQNASADRRKILHSGQY